MSGKRLLFAVAISLVALVAAAGTAGAQDTGGPPDDSELDQYVPLVPEAGADAPLRDVREDARDGKGGGNLPPDVHEELMGAGSLGESAAALAERTAPEGVGAQAGKGDKSASEQGSGRSLSGAVVGTLSGDRNAGMGAVLPLGLAAILVAGIGYALLRRRRRAGEPDPGPPAG